MTDTNNLPKCVLVMDGKIPAAELARLCEEAGVDPEDVVIVEKEEAENVCHDPFMNALIAGYDEVEITPDVLARPKPLQNGDRITKFRKE